MMAKQTTQDDADLIASLGVELEPEKQVKFTPREERVIAGFEDVQRFVEEHGRLPRHGVDLDIFERLYAIRLDRIRESEECMALLAQFDADGLLQSDETGKEDQQMDSDEELLAALGVDTQEQSDISKLKHVRSQVDRKAADEVARREPCTNFEKYKPLFEQVQADLASGAMKTEEFSQDKRHDEGSVTEGDFFVLGGIVVYVESIGEMKITGFNREDARMRLIFANGTESSMLLRSFQRALYKTDNSRRIKKLPTIFDDDIDAEDIEVGYIYVLRSNSNIDAVKEFRDTIHKIGVTGGTVEKRIANAKKDPTYLLAGVEIVATYKLANINRVKLERLIQGFFKDARLDIAMKDRFGHDVKPREWFLVPLSVIHESIELIKQNKLHEYSFDAKNVRLVPNH
tara:strand:+ start:6300 stop:7502 length:1203 start_codon:yes stop_codon:yes gene_type:complete